MVSSLKVGDIVQLKSGGPKMTVTSGLLSSQTHECSWFENTELKHGKFPPDAVVVISEE